MQLPRNADLNSVDPLKPGAKQQQPVDIMLDLVPKEITPANPAAKPPFPFGEHHADE